MALNYKPLWVQLAKKGLKKTDVIAMAGLTTNVWHRWERASR